MKGMTNKRFRVARGLQQDSTRIVCAAMHLLPDDATLSFHLGTAQQDMGEPEGALRAGELEPGYVEAHHRAATLARQLQRPTIADYKIRVMTPQGHAAPEHRSSQKLLS